MTQPTLCRAPTPTSRVVHIRSASTNDALSDKTSARTSVFSKNSSTATKSTRDSGNTANKGYSQLLDALDLELKEQECDEGCYVCTIVDDGEHPDTLETGTVELQAHGEHVVSSTTIPLTRDGNHSLPQKGQHIDPSSHTTEALDPQTLDTASILDQPFSVPRFSIEAELDDATTAAAESRDFTVLVSQMQKSARRQRRWTKKAKTQAKEVTKKATRGVAKAVKQVTSSVMSCGSVAKTA